MAIICDFEVIKPCMQANKQLNTLCEEMQNILLGKYELSDFKDGKRIDIGNGISIIFIFYNTGKEPFFETHKTYIDFQLTINGSEAFLIGNKKDFTIMHEYDANKDLIVYHSNNKTNKILSNAGNLCIFFDYDVHAAGIKDDRLEHDFVYKIVAKVPSELLHFSI